MEGPAKCGGCHCQWFDDICFDGDIECVTPGGCLTWGWRNLDEEGELPRPLRSGVTQ